MNFITYTAHEVFPNIWVIYCIAAFGWSTGRIGLTLTLVGVVATINQASMVGPVVKRLGERRTLLASLVIAVIGLAVMGVNNGYVFFLAAIIVSLPMYQASSQALMTRRVRPEEQGELQGALGSVRGISMLIGPSIFALTFAQFAGPWRSIWVHRRAVAARVAALCRIARGRVACHFARRRCRASGSRAGTSLRRELTKTK